MNSLKIDTIARLCFETFEFLFGDRNVLISGVLEAADKICTLNDDVTAHARAAFFMQQVKRNVLAVCRGMDADRDRY